MTTRIAAICIALFAVSCAPDGDPPADRPAPPATAGAMSAEAAALANLDRSLVTCQTDGDCPRGAHCALSACAYECAIDADCVHGLSCDAKGRCR